MPAQNPDKPMLEAIDLGRPYLPADRRNFSLVESGVVWPKKVLRRWPERPRYDGDLATDQLGNHWRLESGLLEPVARTAEEYQDRLSWDWPEGDSPRDDEDLERWRALNGDA